MYPCKRRFRADGTDYDDDWSSHMVVSDRDVDDLPHSTSQGEKSCLCATVWILTSILTGGVKSFCTIQSDMSEFVVEDFEVEKGGWFKGQTHRVAIYELKVIKGAADIKFELWFKHKKRSEETGVRVNWDDYQIVDEVS